MRKTIMFALSAASIFAMGCSQASAHGAWIAERWGELAVIYGHGAGDDPYDPAKVKSVTAIAANGSTTSVEIETAGHHVVLNVESDPVAMILEFDNGFWSKAADGKWVNKAKDEVPSAQEGGHYIKTNISLLDMHGDLPVFPKQALQIVPLQNPNGLKAGEVYKIKVLHDGKPLEGVEVTLDYIGLPTLKSKKTDQKGEVEVAIRNDGLNVLAVDHTVKLQNDPKADEIG